MSAEDAPPGHRPEPSPAGQRRLLVGKHPADRRVRRTLERSPYFRHAGPGTVTARPAAIEPAHPGDRIAARARRALKRSLLGRPNILVAAVPYRRDM